MIQLVRYSKENPNWEKALEGKWGSVGEDWGCVSVLRNMLFAVAYPGAQVSDYKIPEVYDGFFVDSTGTTWPVNDSTINLQLAPGVSAQAVLKLRKDN
jgi:hypothetical protein